MWVRWIGLFSLSIIPSFSTRITRPFSLRYYNIRKLSWSACLSACPTAWYQRRLLFVLGAFVVVVVHVEHRLVMEAIKLKMAQQCDI